MNRILAYIQSAYQELMHKVTWPSWGELQSSAVVVLIASAVIGVLVLLMDLVSRQVITDFVYKMIMG